MKVFLVVHVSVEADNENDAIEKVSNLFDGDFDVETIDVDYIEE